LHTLAETMNSFAAACVGLECTFHCLKVFLYNYLISRWFLVYYQVGPGFPAEREAKVTHSGFIANNEGI
jgi:hypothetical protein